MIKIFCTGDVVNLAGNHALTVKEDGWCFVNDTGQLRGANKDSYFFNHP